MVIRPWSGSTAEIQGGIVLDADYVIINGESFSSPNITFSRGDGGSADLPLLEIAGDDVTVWQCKFEGTGPCGPTTSNSQVMFGDPSTSVTRPKLINCLMDGEGISHKGLYVHACTSLYGIYISKILLAIISKLHHAQVMFLMD